MIIRSAREEDAEAICAIINQVIRDTVITFTTVERTPDAIHQSISAAPGTFLVAEEAGETLGLAYTAPFRNGPGYAHTAEHTVYLTEAAQGRGTGRALMQALEAAAQQAGIHVLVAGISGANPRAIAFHAAMGFSETARMPEVGHKHGQWLDLVLMQKILTPGIPAPDSPGKDR